MIKRTQTRRCLSLLTLFILMLVVSVNTNVYLGPSPPNGILNNDCNKEECQNRASAYPENIPELDFLDFSVTEFNESGPITDDKYGIIYQAGEAETAAFYSVSGASILNVSKHHTTGFNFTLPDPYYKYWSFSYLSYFNLTEVVKQENIFYYADTSSSTETLNIQYAMTEENTELVEITSRYENVYDIQLQFANIQLQPGDTLKVYNDTYDEDKLLYELTSANVDALLPTGLTSWFESGRAVLEIKSINSSLTSFELPSLNYKADVYEDSVDAGEIRNNHYGSLIEVDPDIIGFNVSISQITLTTGAKFFISDPTGKNITLFDNTNVSIINDAIAQYGSWGHSEWIQSLGSGYCVFAFDLTSAAPAEYENNGFTISRIEYLTPQGWQRIYAEETAKLSQVLTYDDYGTTVSIDFTNLYVNDTENDKGFYAAYSSWTFVWDKISIDYDVQVYRDEPVGPDVALGNGDVKFYHGEEYRIQVTAYEPFTKEPIENYNLPQHGYQEFGLENIRLDRELDIPIDEYSLAMRIDYDVADTEVFINITSDLETYGDFMLELNKQLDSETGERVSAGIIKGDIRIVSNATGESSIIQLKKLPALDDFLTQMIGADSPDPMYIGADLIYNDIQLQFTQNEEIKYDETKDILNGNSNFTFTGDWDKSYLIHQGMFKAMTFTSGLNHWAFDNTSSQAAFKFFLYEAVSLDLNLISSEELGVVTGSDEVSQTTGTTFDPNLVTINLTATDQYGESETLNGQPIGVIVFYDKSVVLQDQIYQYTHSADNQNYATFTHSYNKSGDWQVKFTLENSSLNKPNGFFIPTDPVWVNVTSIPRQYTLDIQTDVVSYHAGDTISLYAHVYDKEETLAHGAYPIEDTQVDFYFLKWHLNQMRKYPLGTAYTNGSGIAEMNWIPPLDLIDAEVYIYIDIFTKDGIIDQFVSQDQFMGKGYQIEKMGTIIEASTSQQIYYYDDPLVLYSGLFDELGNVVLNQEYLVSLLLENGTSIEYSLLSGKNNSKVEVNLNRFVGTIDYTFSFNGSGDFVDAENVSGSVEYIKSNSTIEIEVDAQDYEFKENDTIPIDVDILDYRQNDLIDNEGIFELEIFNQTGERIYYKLEIVNDVAHYNYSDWQVEENGIYYLNASFTSADYHNDSHVSQTIFVDRSEISLNLSYVPLKAGENLVMYAEVKYEVNQTILANKSVVFEYSDQMGNTYLLGFGQTNSSGIAELVYNFTATDYLYLNMVEFGGDLSATSEMSLQHKSGFDILFNFQIEKAKTQVVVSPSVELVKIKEDILISISLNFPENPDLISEGEILTVEIWSDSSAYQKSYDITMGEDAYIITFTPLDEGNYFIKALYKGSHIYEAEAGFNTFECEGTFFSSIGAGALPSGAVGGSFLGILAITLGSILLFFKNLSFFGINMTGSLKLKLWAFIMGLMIFSSGMYYMYIAIESNNAQRSLLGEVGFGSQSNFEWIETFVQDGGDLASIGLGEASNYIDESSIDAINSVSDVGSVSSILGEIGSIQNTIEHALNNVPAEPIDDGTTISSTEEPIAADGDSFKEVSLGTYGTIPYPIGDILNITFSTTQDSIYTIYIVDINLHKRVVSLYGSAKENELKRIFIPISEENFNVGGKYALELYVYEEGVTNYWQRDMRRMTFNVIKGYTTMEVVVPDIKIYEDRYFEVQLFEDYSNKPLANKRVSIMRYDSDIDEYIFYRNAFTDRDGKLALMLPENTVKGEVPLQIIYNGDDAHNAAQLTPSYEIQPIDTFLSLSAPTVHYTDIGQVSAVLRDEYGTPLADQKINFIIHIENRTIGDYDLTNITDSWQNLGNASTNEFGFASLDYDCIYPEGIYEVAASYDGTDIYNQSYISGDLLEVFKEELDVTFVDTHALYGSSSVLSAYLSDNDGEPSAFTPVKFEGYYQHNWYELGECNTTADGNAIIETTVYWDEGYYPLRLTKEVDDRYATNVELGKMYVEKTNASIDIFLNSTSYSDDITLNALFNFQNGTDAVPLEGETLIFYVYNHNMPSGEVSEYIYIGNGITDADGIASIVWKATLKPDVYSLKVLYPGNDYIKTFEAEEYGLEIIKKVANITISAPTSSAVMDYADFKYILTDPVEGNPITGEVVNVKIYNKTNPEDLIVERDVVSNGDGVAFFRWVPGSPGEYICEANLVSDYYAESQVTFWITITRKSIIFDTEVNSIRFYRGEVCDLSGDAMMIYKHYNGSEEIIPAMAVPLMFHIWNESNFIHPVSGFFVPNVPISYLDDGSYRANGYTEYTRSTQANAGYFDWKWMLPDEFYGLQAGQYMLRIKVDETKTGLYTGEGFISFDLVEHTSASVWIDKSDEVIAAQDAGRIPGNHDFFVNETETINIQLHDQDADAIQEFDHELVTYRDLLINIGEEKILYFHLDKFNNPTIYEGDSIKPENELTDELQPAFDRATGIYSFKYKPYLAGYYEIGVSYAGDRFFDPVVTQMQRRVYKRPTYFTTTVSHTQELYRHSTPLDFLQKTSDIECEQIDTIWLIPVQKKRIEYYFNKILMTESKGFSLDVRATGSDGIVSETWEFSDILQNGDQEFYFLSPEDRIYEGRKSQLYTMEIWETTSMTVSSDYVNKYIRYSMEFYDQDMSVIPNAQFSIVCAGQITGEEYGGDKRLVEVGMAAGGIAEILWDPSEYELGTGYFYVFIDYLTDEIHNLRAASFRGSGYLQTSAPLGHSDVLYHSESEFGPVESNPYAAWDSEDMSKIYYNLNEMRLEHPMITDTTYVNTFDGFGAVLAKDAYYVWVSAFKELQYSPSYQANSYAILAFAQRENAHEFMDLVADYFNPHEFHWSNTFPVAEQKGVVSGAPAAASTVRLAEKIVCSNEVEWMPLPSITVTNQFDMLKAVLNDQINAAVAEMEPMIADYQEERKAGAVAGFFHDIYEGMMSKQMRFIYCLPFKVIELGITGGKKEVPDRDQEVWRTTTETSDQSVNFDSDANDLYSNTESTPSISTMIRNSKYGTEKILRAESSAQGGIAGESFSILLNTNFNMQEFNDIKFSFKSDASTSSDLHSAGIKIILVDSNGLTATKVFLPDTRIYRDMLTEYTIPVLEFTPEEFFDISSVSKIKFEAVSNGLLTINDRLYIDDIQFVSTSAGIVTISVSQPPIQLNIGELILQEFVVRVLLKAVYDAVSFAIGQVFGDIAGAFISIDTIMNVVVDSVLKGMDDKPLGEILWDIIYILFSSFQNISDKVQFNMFSGQGRSIYKLEQGLSKFVDYEIHLDYLKKPRFYLFIITDAIAQMAMTIPGYYTDHWEVWIRVFEKGHSLIKVIKYGHKRVPWKHELIMATLGILMTMIEWFIVKFVGGKAGTVVKRVMARLWSYIMRFFKLTVSSSGESKGSVNEIGGVSTKSLMSAATKVLFAPMIVDLAIDICLDLISLPWWLKWLLDTIVRLLAKLVIFLIIFPVELSSFFFKAMFIIVLSTLISSLVTPTFLKMIGIKSPTMTGDPRKTYTARLWDGEVYAQ